ncbi:MAG: class E sortase [Rubrobacteraceae bacterium]
MKRIRTGQTKRMLTAGAIALTFAVAGFGLLGYSLFGGSEPASAETPDKATRTIPRSIPEKIFTSISEQFQAPRAEAPKDPGMKLTVPEMERVENVPVYNTAPKGYEKALHDGTVHVKGTGFPWQDEANVYIAGHRLGYPGTKSDRVFWDLDKLEDGDEVILTDADGTKYTYEVFKEFITGPSDVSVLKPEKGKNIVSLQTCTLPDYSERMIVQAELKSVD